ncbi:peptide/nickel transport system ATP-binding protein [Kribbella orskensis]|uniref:Peptide/nickel transport system ATP-binding protein n=1 Tax=Kribbella orskensis TaxID=2512216 RepID=A0ABY2BND8_9ACTN|nr:MULTISPECIES: ABC transporter ATP-binding protein [Kribbella]TCN41940.1 peptide/nickel transport system ATP-binding protein [Kribbella sp. VKM Ac-2500]TCO25818.1 peptide/nickel transport system ATP-binding protein [Kribbella orskensis]
MSEPTVLEVSGLEVTYSTNRGDVRAVQGLDLSVRRGEILGVAGESGSGKSTLAVALLRLLKPPGKVTAGSAIFHPKGRSPVDLLKVEGEELRVLRWSALSYLPQGSQSSLNPVMRVEDQFRDVILEHAPERKEALSELIHRLLAQVGLEPRVARMHPHELSGGMKQRVLMAICVALEPDLVIADEPTTALDVTIQRVILQSLADLRDDFGVTLMVISHDMGVHAQLADRVAVMYEGRLVEVGDVHQVFKDPRHEYTRQLIESIPRVGRRAS